MPRGKIQPEERISTAKRKPRRGVSYCGFKGCQGPRECKDCHCIYMRQWRYAGREKHYKTGERRRVMPRGIATTATKQERSRSRGKVPAFPLRKQPKRKGERQHEFDRRTGGIKWSWER